MTVVVDTPLVNRSSTAPNEVAPKASISIVADNNLVIY
jgi:hypothetical protein